MVMKQDKQTGERDKKNPKSKPSQQYSSGTFRLINGTNSPFFEAHNICLNSRYSWSVYLKSGSLNIHYPNSNSTYFCMSQIL